VGLKAFESLNASQNWIKLDATGQSILPSAMDQSQIQNESHLIQLLTKRMQELVEKASQQLGFPLVLVNTERHAYFKDPHGGADTTPDMLVTHPAFFTWKLSDVDKIYATDGFLYGQGADWCLRDCWEVIIEWKTDIGTNDFRALGEAIEYARRKSFVKGKEVAADWSLIRFSRLMICDSKCFHLVLCDNSHATKCVYGEWVDPGSEQAVLDFIVRGFQVDYMRRLWVDALQRVCIQFKVELKLPCETEPTCFLGAGGCGRVFRVVSQDMQCCIKVGLGDQACSQIQEEWSKFKEFEVHFGDARAALVSISKHYQCPQRSFAAILLQPVGTPLRKTKTAIKSALDGLLKLSKNGFGHGDARLCNVVWTSDGACKWLDFRTLYQCFVGEAQMAFIRDVTSFSESLGVQPTQSLTSTAASCFVKSSIEDSLLNHFKSLWESGR
jgi:hypothetical protein